ncbi:MAG: hypothetical protein LW595_01690 [Rickettsiales bacterium]|jgi:hypothetical protein|nr:hypothetical protein [Rickettsiales bacterium]
MNKNKITELTIFFVLLVIAFLAGVKYSDPIKLHASWLFEAKEEELELPDMSNEENAEELNIEQNQPANNSQNTNINGNEQVNNIEPANHNTNNNQASNSGNPQINTAPTSNIAPDKK